MALFKITRCSKAMPPIASCAAARIRLFQAKVKPEISDDKPMSEFYNTVVANRRKYLAPSLRTFEAYDKPLVLVKGNMQYMWDSEGNKYIDLLGQNLCISVGHNHPKVTKAAIEQMQLLPHCTTMYYHEHSAELGKAIVEKMPKHPSGDEWVVHLVNSGSEAVDLAVQMARVYTGRPEIIGLHKAYHGLQGYAAGLTAIGKSTQSSYSSMFSSIAHIPANRADNLRDHLQFATGGKVAAFIAESLQGYGGIFPLQDGFLAEAFDTVRKHGGVAIADEVQTGYNRCGDTFWGFEMKHNQAIPDMVTVAKGMGNGIGIIAAVICTRSIAEAFAAKMFFNTYAANPVACAAARAVLRVMDEDKVRENCKAMGDLFRSRLSVLCKELPQVLKEVRGSGLFQGLEIAGKTVEDSGKNAFELHRRIRNYGVVLGRGSAAGNVFRVQPPMCIQAPDVHKVCDSIEAVAREWIKEKNL